MQVTKELIQKARESLSELGEQGIHTIHIGPVYDLVNACEIDLTDSTRKKELQDVVDKTYKREMGMSEDKA